MSTDDGVVLDTDRRKLPKANGYRQALSSAQKAMEPWNTLCDNIHKEYIRAQGKGERRFAMLYANQEVLRPAVYARPPVPVVVPRFQDAGSVPKEASQVLERALLTNSDLEGLDERMRSVRDDFLLEGRGVAWVRQADQGRVTVERLARRDFVHEPARTWSEVGWVARRAFLTRNQVKARFPRADRSMLVFEERRGEDAGASAKGAARKAAIWEMWSKTENRVVWFAESARGDGGDDHLLDARNPYLDLMGFFPCPPPIYGVTERDSLIPVPDFVFYKDQAEEINELTQRISALSDALRMRGFYPAGASDVSDALEAAIRSDEDGAVLIPVASLASLGAGSLKDSVIWMPVRDVAVTIKELVALRAQLIQDVYQITGISDIVRGATNPNETASAQQLKAQWGSVRIRERQAALSRLARDITRLVGEVMAENTEADDLQRLAQTTLKRDADLVEPMRALQMQIGQATSQGKDARPLQEQLHRLAQTVTIEKVVGFLRNERVRAFAIDIETDSTIQPDEDAEKQRRTEFLTAMGAFFAQMGPVVQGLPQAGPFVGEALRFAAGGFRAGRQLEDAIEDVAKKIAESANQPQGPTPEQQKAQAEAEMAKAKQADASMKVQAEIGKIAAETQKLQAEVQKMMRPDTPQGPNIDGARLMIDREKMDRETALKREELQLKDRIAQREHAAKLRMRRLDLLAQGIDAGPVGDGDLLEMPTVSQDFLAPIAQQIADLTASLGQLAEMQAQTAAAQQAPKQIIRDDLGNVIGVQSAAGAQRLIRDDSGAAVGIEPVTVEQ